MDLCDSCIHARDSEGQPICHAFRWLVKTAEELAAAVNEEDMPIMRLAEPMLAVTECRAYVSNGQESRAKVLSLVRP